MILLPQIWNKDVPLKPWSAALNLHAPVPQCQQSNASLL